MKKRGQITVFMIIGIIILLSVAVFLYLRAEITEIKPSTIIPPQVIPIQRFVTDCMHDYGKDAIIKIGNHGGYLEVPALYRNTHDSYIPMEPSNTLIVPYWYYEGESRVPSIEDMQADIEGYVDDNLKACLGNFTAFEDQFRIEHKDLPDTEVLIGESTVTIKTFYPVRVENIGKRQITLLEEHIVVMPVKFKRIYELANDIMEAENEQGMFENMTIDLMVLDPEIPFSGMSFRCGVLTWFEAKIKEELQDVMFRTIIDIRFKNTDYIPFFEKESVYEKFRNLDVDENGRIINLPKIPLPRDAYQYFHYFFDVTDEDYSDLKVTAQYNPDWGMDLHARPSHNGVLKSSFGKGFSKYLRFLCINLYHFVYDVVYPVQISVADPDAFEGEGYTFNFAFPVIIQDNEVHRAKIAFKETQSPEFFTGVCTDRGDDTVEIRARDAITYADLNKVNITYECFNFVCEVGKTRADGGIYRLRTNMPESCINGNIRASREGFFSKSIQYDGSDYFEVFLTPTKKMNFNITKRRSNFLDDAEPIEDDETLLIQIENKDYPEYYMLRTFPFEEDMPDTLREIELFEDSTTYDVTIVLYKEEIGIIGGWIGEWAVSYNDVVNNNELMFNVWEQIPWPGNDMEQAQIMANLEESYSKQITHNFKN